VVPDTRWLNDEEQRAWRSYLTSCRLVFDRIERQLQQEAGLPHAYYEILVRLSEAPEHMMRMSQLATSAMSSRSRLSHAVARLEESGWVRRRPCLDDRRGAIAELTDEGLAHLEAAAPGHVETVRQAMFDALSAEQLRALRDVSDTLVANLADAPVWPASEDRYDDVEQ